MIHIIANVCLVYSHLIYELYYMIINIIYIIYNMIIMYYMNCMLNYNTLIQLFIKVSDSILYQNINHIDLFIKSPSKILFPSKFSKSPIKFSKY